MSTWRRDRGDGDGDADGGIAVDDGEELAARVLPAACAAWPPPALHLLRLTVFGEREGGSEERKRIARGFYSALALELAPLADPELALSTHTQARDYGVISSGMVITPSDTAPCGSNEQNLLTVRWRFFIFYLILPDKHGRILG
jgi:hypothetical protein